ncbi:MAG: glycosyltransferase family 2 protein [Rubrobacter sp.]
MTLTFRVLTYPGQVDCSNEYECDGAHPAERRSGSLSSSNRPAIALLASYNEERYVETCLRHLVEQEVDFYLIDNESTDRTVEIARTFEGRGLRGIEQFPRPGGVYPWLKILKRKEELAGELEGRWFMHQDMDELRYSDQAEQTLGGAFAEIEDLGYNAVNFLEFTFVPTREEPDHDHKDFAKTMRSYYPFTRGFPFQVKAWKKQPGRVGLAEPSGGHRVGFEGRLIYPRPLVMLHYPYLSIEHFEHKYLPRRYDAEELKRSWHGWRANLAPEKISLPSEGDLSTAASVGELSLARPRLTHIASEWTRSKQAVEKEASEV